MDTKDLNNKSVLILGAGKTGIASAFFLLNKAKEVLLSESKDEKEEIRNEIIKLKNQGVKVEFKKHSEDFAKKADLVIISPGISPQTEIVKKINSMRIPLISDIELASCFINKPIIAVTGTNGKTTTTALITHIINNSGKKAIACGNIGLPLIEVINDKEIDFYVLEISSFQIYYCKAFSPEIAVCLNITPDHLDWHGSFNNYFEAKKKLFLQQKKDSWAVLNLDNKLIKDFKPKNNVFYFSTSGQIAKKDIAYLEGGKLKIKYKNELTEILDRSDLKILGIHNIENILASIAVSKILDLENKNISNSLKSFQGVEHRLEFTKTVQGKEFYNDSKATNPEATVKAIEALSNCKGKKITLILGGRDKNTSLDEMTDVIKNNVTDVLLYGEARDRFNEELVKKGFVSIKTVNSLNDAIQESLKSKTEVVLFSPACSSFDMFKNYEERGRIFKELVSKL